MSSAGDVLQQSHIKMQQWQKPYDDSKHKGWPKISQFSKVPTTKTPNIYTEKGRCRDIQTHILKPASVTENVCVLWALNDFVQLVALPDETLLELRERYELTVYLHSEFTARIVEHFKQVYVGRLQWQ